MPMGQMPVLEVSGKRVYQSISIARYLAKQLGLAGADDWEALLVDIAVDNVNIFFPFLFFFIFFLLFIFVFFYSFNSILFFLWNLYR